MRFRGRVLRVIAPILPSIFQTEASGSLSDAARLGARCQALACLSILPFWPQCRAGQPRYLSLVRGLPRWAMGYVEVVRSIFTIVFTIKRY